MVIMNPTVRMERLLVLLLPNAFDGLRVSDAVISTALNLSTNNQLLVMQRLVPTIILRTETDEHLSILREMLRIIDS